MMTTDDELVRGFEERTLPKAEFTHAAHVRAAWWYLRRYPFEEATDRFRIALRGYAESLGAASKYDDALTRTWMRRIGDRLDEEASLLAWDAFAVKNADLFVKSGGAG